MHELWLSSTMHHYMCNDAIHIFPTVWLQFTHGSEFLDGLAHSAVDRNVCVGSGVRLLEVRFCGYAVVMNQTPDNQGGSSIQDECGPPSWKIICLILSLFVVCCHPSLLMFAISDWGPPNMVRLPPFPPTAINASTSECRLPAFLLAT